SPFRSFRGWASYSSSRRLAALRLNTPALVTSPMAPAAARATAQMGTLPSSGARLPIPDAGAPARPACAPALPPAFGSWPAVVVVPVPPAPVVAVVRLGVGVAAPAAPLGTGVLVGGGGGCVGVVVAVSRTQFGPASAAFVASAA